MDVDKKFEESIEKALSDSDKLIEISYDKYFDNNASLIRESASDIRGLAKLVRVYDRNIKNAVKQMVEMAHTVKDLQFKVFLMQALLDKETNDAISLLSEKRKELDDDSDGTPD